MGLKYSEVFIHDIAKTSNGWVVMLCHLGGFQIGAMEVRASKRNLEHKVCSGCVQDTMCKKRNLKNIRSLIKEAKKQVIE